MCYDAEEMSLVEMESALKECIENDLRKEGSRENKFKLSRVEWAIEEIAASRANGVNINHQKIKEMLQM